MSQRKHTPRQGSATANELYLSVGVALSWWEARETAASLSSSRLNLGYRIVNQRGEIV